MSRFDEGSNRPRRQAAVDDQSLNFLMMIFAAILLLLLITGVYFIAINVSGGIPQEEDDPGIDFPVSDNAEYPYRQEISVTVPSMENSVAISKTDGTSAGIYSDFAALVDLTTGEVIASRKGAHEISPASMVKVMTLIVVMENLKTTAAMDEELTLSNEVVTKMYAEGSSGFGFQVGEKLTVRALLHAMILQSDGIAALTLAEYIAGSESAFVELMNQKALEIGMDTTNFANCTGLEQSYLLSTCKDMAVMMSYAMQNPFCAEILSAKSYKLPDSFRTDGPFTLWHTTLASHFDRLKPSTPGITVKAAKSGYIGEESGHCLVTYAEGTNGHKYVLVTAKAPTRDSAIADMAYIYNTYIK